MTREEKMMLCAEFFYKLVDILHEEYECVGSCNKDLSRYLIPKGTIDQLSYYGKPDRSFRLSDHWSWYANIKKCSWRDYIQCLSVDLPWVKPRKDDKATKPKLAAQVALIGSDGKYHAVYGEVYDRKTKTWSWLINDPQTIAAMVM